MAWTWDVLLGVWEIFGSGQGWVGEVPCRVEGEREWLFTDGLGVVWMDEVGMNVGT